MLQSSRSIASRGKATITIVMAGSLMVPWLMPPGLAAERTAGKNPKAKPAGLPQAVMADPPSTIMEVAPVDRSQRPAVLEAAAAIDKLLAAHLQEHGVSPAPPLNDAQFLRRIYLELGGRIPDYDEARLFLASKKKTKRADLVDDLLESPDYVSHFYNYWADILRLRERSRDRPFEPYLWYVQDSIRTNKPFDQWVHEMLTADGRLWENPAVGFQLRDYGMPLPYVDNTVRVFLGTQIGCAQCHDHPFDDWTQHQFYELAAFLSDADGLSRQHRVRKTFWSEAKEKLGYEKYATFHQFFLANLESVSFQSGRQPLKLPHDYKYDDAKPLSVVSPKVLWGEVPSGARDANRREQFAAWMTGRDNRQFARTIANRMWKKVMGLGLVEPVDDFQPGNPASIPALLEHLTDEMLRLDFDLREFVRILVSTDTYQRVAIAHDPSSGTPFRFAAPALRRMTAEQLWDSILTLVARNVWAVRRPTPAEIAATVSLSDPLEVTADEAIAQFNAFQKTNTIRQANYVHIRGKQLLETIGYKDTNILRASELPAPLPLAHFLRQFGQSDRESIEGGRTVATVPQILAMFNGPITHSMLEEGSVIYDNVVKQRRPEEAVVVVFVSVLSREPSAYDRKLARDEIKTAGTPAAGFGNLIWALLNTREFLFVE